MASSRVRGAALTALGSSLFGASSTLLGLGEKKREREEGAKLRGIQEDLGKEQLLGLERERETAELEKGKLEDITRKKRIFSELLRDPDIQDEVKKGVQEAVIQKQGTQREQFQPTADQPAFQPPVQGPQLPPGQALPPIPAPTTPLQRVTESKEDFLTSDIPEIQTQVKVLQEQQQAGVEREQEVSDVELERKREVEDVKLEREQEVEDRDIKIKARERLAAITAQYAKDRGAGKTGSKQERKSTTQSAKIIAHNGFALENFKNLREMVVKGGSVIETTGAGEFINPKFRNAIEHLVEVHGREKSGAAISAKEWTKFEKQVLNQNLLLTEAGRKEILENIDRMAGQTFAKADGVSDSDDWFKEYQESAARGVEAIGGGAAGGLTPEEKAELEELERKDKEGTLQ